MTYITRKNPIDINITPANFIPAKFAPYKTISKAEINKKFFFKFSSHEKWFIWDLPAETGTDVIKPKVTNIE